MRKSSAIPTGTQCLNQDIPEATWNLPGLFVFDEFFFSEWPGMNEMFGVKPPVNSVSGSRNVLWNAGRVAPDHVNHGANKATYAQRLAAYKKFGVNCYYTFSNNRITEKHLADKTCNEMLQAMVENDHDGDGVIFSSDLLANYIRKNYPSLKLKVSVIKSDIERAEGRDAQWYNDLADKYDIVVLQPDDNFNIELLSSLEKKEKFELLVNEPCVQDCRFRKRHYDETAQIAIGGYKNFSKLNKFYDVGGLCKIQNYTHHDPRMRTNVRACRLSRGELKELYDMGFRLFKLQGRNNQTQLAYDMSHFMYDNDFFSNMSFGVQRDMINQANAKKR